MRPRVIVTELATCTDREKFAFLLRQQYRLAGFFGTDSIWVSESHPLPPAVLRFLILSLPEDWEFSEEGRHAIDSMGNMAIPGSSD